MAAILESVVAGMGFTPKHRQCVAEAQHEGLHIDTGLMALFSPEINYRWAERDREKLRDLKRDLPTLLLTGIWKWIGACALGECITTSHVTFPRLFITDLHKPGASLSAALPDVEGEKFGRPMLPLIRFAKSCMASVGKYLSEVCGFVASRHPQAPEGQRVVFDSHFQNDCTSL